MNLVVTENNRLTWTDERHGAGQVILLILGFIAGRQTGEFLRSTFEFLKVLEYFNSA